MNNYDFSGHCHNIIYLFKTEVIGFKVKSVFGRILSFIPNIRSILYTDSNSSSTHAYILFCSENYFSSIQFLGIY